LAGRQAGPSESTARPVVRPARRSARRWGSCASCAPPCPECGFWIRTSARSPDTSRSAGAA